jgi:hypothetical protein
MTSDEETTEAPEPGPNQPDPNAVDSKFRIWWEQKNPTKTFEHHYVQMSSFWGWYIPRSRKAVNEQCRAADDDDGEAGAPTGAPKAPGWETVPDARAHVKDALNDQEWEEAVAAQKVHEHENKKPRKEDPAGEDSSQWVEVRRGARKSSDVKKEQPNLGHDRVKSPRTVQATSPELEEAVFNPWLLADQDEGTSKTEFWTKVRKFEKEARDDPHAWLMKPANYDLRTDLETMFDRGDFGNDVPEWVRRAVSVSFHANLVMRNLMFLWSYIGRLKEVEVTAQNQKRVFEHDVLMTLYVTTVMDPQRKDSEMWPELWKICDDVDLPAIFRPGAKDIPSRLVPLGELEKAQLEILKEGMSIAGIAGRIEIVEAAVSPTGESEKRFLVITDAIPGKGSEGPFSVTSRTSDGFVYTCSSAARPLVLGRWCAKGWGWIPGGGATAEYVVPSEGSSLTDDSRNAKRYYSVHVRSGATPALATDSEVPYHTYLCSLTRIGPSQKGKIGSFTAQTSSYGGTPLLVQTGIGMLNQVSGGGGAWGWRQHSKWDNARCVTDEFRIGLGTAWPMKTSWSGKTDSKWRTYKKGQGDYTYCPPHRVMVRGCLLKADDIPDFVRGLRLGAKDMGRIRKVTD